MNKELLHILLSNPKLKNHFFTDVEGVLVFDKNKFTWTIENKEFLPDSYTRFKQKIGLIDSNERFISSNNDVVLSFPYKDCVLEGGQTKEDQKRREIFFNETLAPEDVDCLLAPKVFTNIKKYTKDGGEPVSSISLSDNLLIKGNNLLALSSLQKRYQNKVKLIYIDPPYNTGNDFFGYNDSFNHSTWLVFMKNRLEISKRLLREDGVICIQCDDNEQAYLKVLCDEVFGIENHLNTVVVKSSESSGNKMSHVDKKFPKIKDYILIYKMPCFETMTPVKVSKIDNMEEFKKYAKYYSNIILDKSLPVNTWKIMSIKNYIKKYEPSIDISNEQAVLQFKIDNAERVVYRTNNKSLDKYSFSSKTEEIISSTGHKYIWWEGKQMLFLSDYTSSYLCDLWTDISTINLNKEGAVTLKNGKKPELLIKRIIECFTNENDIVLDFFLGSGTTAAVALKMKRQFIGVEQMDYIEDLAVVRLNNVISGEMFGISKSLKWQGGGSFVYCELKELNQDYIKQIQNAGSDPQLIELYNKISKSKFINSKVKPSDIESNVSDFESLSTESKRKLLIQLLDLNMLYVNYSDIDDEEYKVSDSDKSFNRSFYGD